MKSLLSGVSTAIIALLVGFCVGCGGGGGDVHADLPLVPPLIHEGQPVTGTIIGTESFTAVQGYLPAQRLKVWVNRYGFDRTEYPVEFIAAIEEEGVRKIVCRTTGDLKIGHGDSGSPLLTTDNRVIGAIAQIFADGDTTHFKCTAIEDMLKVGTLSRAVSPSHAEGIWIIQGVGNDFLARLAASGQDFGITDANCVRVEALSRSVVSATPPSRLLPGHTVTFDYLRGPVNYVVAGTITHEPLLGKYLALGHGLDLTGAAAVPITPGFTLGLISTANAATKAVVPAGNPIGSMVRDERTGVMLEWGNIPERTHISTRVIAPMYEQGEYDHYLTRDGGSARECELLRTALVTPVDIYLRQQTAAGAECTLLLQVAGEREEIYPFVVDPLDDVLLGYGGIADQVRDLVRQVSLAYPGRPFVNASLDVSIVPDSL